MLAVQRRTTMLCQVHLEEGRRGVRRRGILHALCRTSVVEHQALHLPRVRGCFGCDRGKALHRHASKAERTNRTAVESTRASFLQASFPDTWWAVCMIYFVAMWNGHMRGRDGFTPYQRRHGENAPYRMYPWRSLVFAHLHKPVVEDEEESDRWRSKLTPCILVEVTMGPAGLWVRCYGVVPLFRFTDSNRPLVVHVRRSIDIDFPEIVSYPLR